MPDYIRSKIYQIICNTTGRRYIGATVQKYLSARLATHVSKKNTTSSNEIIDGGNYEMLLIESYPCSSKDQLHQRERFYIESMECVNKQIPCRTKEEKKEYNKYYYDENKVDILKQQKYYYDENKEQKLVKQKDYYDENKVEILKQNKIRYVDNREQILAKQKKYDKINRDIINQKKREQYQAKKQTQEEHRAQRRDYWQSKKDSTNSLSQPE